MARQSSRAAQRGRACGDSRAWTGPDAARSWPASTCILRSRRTSRPQGARRCRDLVGRLGARTHRADCRAIVVGAGRSPHPGYRCNDAPAKAEAIRLGINATMRVGLRVRFGVAAVLMVCTTVIASMWTLAALSRLSNVATDTVRESEPVTALTSKLSGALEREDDAVLLVLAGDRRGATVLSRERRIVDGAVSELFDVLGPADERDLARPLLSALQAYRRAADGVAAMASERDALVQYHRQANPLP